MMQPFILSFIPLFVAIDVLGLLPFFISLTSEMSGKQRRTVANESAAVACLLALSFMFLGKLILGVLGVTVFDFKIAGGILLLVISIHLLLPGRSRFSSLPEDKVSVGIFPLATPLITGPAVLTTTLILVDKFGILLTTISVVSNMLILWLVFLCSERVFLLIGQFGSRAFSKVSYIMLSAIAVMLIRQGIIEAFF